MTPRWNDRNTGSALQRLLEPIDLEAFLARHLGREPLLVKRGDAAFYTGLHSLAAVDRFLSEGKSLLTASHVTLKRNGTAIPLRDYTYVGYRDSPSGVRVQHDTIDLDAVLRLFSTGATLLLNAAHELHEPLGLVAGQLHGELQAVVHANVYVSPPAAIGARLHYDAHDVFVLQTHGAKRWRWYEPDYPDPLRNLEAGISRSRLLGDALLECGDLLYLPRGTPHETETAAETSVHVTLGAQTAKRTAAGLLHEAVDAMARTIPELRRTAPTGEHALATWADAAFKKAASALAVTPPSSFAPLAFPEERAPRSAAMPTIAALRDRTAAVTFVTRGRYAFMESQSGQPQIGVFGRTIGVRPGTVPALRLLTTAGGASYARLLEAAGEDDRLALEDALVELALAGALRLS